MIPRISYIAYVVLFSQPAMAQAPATQRLCLAGDKSLECNIQGLKTNAERSDAEFKEYLEQNRIKAEQRKAAETEQRRLKAIQDTGCNPRVQRCK